MSLEKTEDGGVDGCFGRFLRAESFLESYEDIAQGVDLIAAEWHTVRMRLQDTQRVWRSHFFSERDWGLCVNCVKMVCRICKVLCYMYRVGVFGTYEKQKRGTGSKLKAVKEIMVGGGSEVGAVGMVEGRSRVKSYRNGNDERELADCQNVIKDER